MDKVLKESNKRSVKATTRTNTACIAPNQYSYAATLISMHTKLVLDMQRKSVYYSPWQSSNSY